MAEEDKQKFTPTVETVDISKSRRIELYRKQHASIKKSITAFKRNFNQEVVVLIVPKKKEEKVFIVLTHNPWFSCQQVLGNTEGISEAYAHFGLVPNASDDCLIAEYCMMKTHNAGDRRHFRTIARQRNSDVLDRFLSTGSYKQKKVLSSKVAFLFISVYLHSHIVLRAIRRTAFLRGEITITRRAPPSQEQATVRAPPVQVPAPTQASTPPPPTPKTQQRQLQLLPRPPTSPPPPQQQQPEKEQEIENMDIDG
ncbi:hypothetical protein MBANPS3_007454 [Mucor bainieri]